MLNLTELINLLINALSIILTIYIFEGLKGLISTALGDTTPKTRGWLTLNPFKFFEPIGFFLFLFYGFGWGHSTETSSMNYKNRKQGTLMTYGLPIVLSFVLGVVIIKLIGFVELNLNYYVTVLLKYLGFHLINIAVFNIIPLTPMAGSKIIKLYLSPNAALRFSQNEKLYQMMFMFLWFVGIVPNILSFVVTQLVLILL